VNTRLEENLFNLGTGKRAKFEEGIRFIEETTEVFPSYSPSCVIQYTRAAPQLFHPTEIISEGDKLLHWSISPWKSCEPIVLVSKQQHSSCSPNYFIYRKVSRKFSKWIQIRLPAVLTDVEKAFYAGEDQYAVTTAKGDIHILTAELNQEPVSNAIQGKVEHSFSIEHSPKDVQVDILGHIWINDFDGQTSILRAFSKDGSRIFDFRSHNIPSCLPFLMNVTPQGVQLYCNSTSSIFTIDLSTFAIGTLADYCPVVRCRAFYVSTTKREAFYVGQLRGTLSSRLPRLLRHDLDTQEVEELEILNCNQQLLIPVSMTQDTLFLSRDKLASVFMLTFGTDI